MLGPVAAHSQYLLGLKHKALITSPPSKVYKCLPSPRSHSIAWPSCKKKKKKKKNCFECTRDIYIYTHTF